MPKTSAIQIPEDDSLFQAVRATLSRHAMIRPGDGVLVGVSGGPDSVALLLLLAALAGRLRLRLGVAHYHHGLRGDAADRDARRVEDLARSAGFPFFYARGDVAAYRQAHGLSIEEAARDLRYAFFESQAQRYGFRRIALGHHADDNAELVLMRLLRGSGPLGLSGIPPWRTCGEGQLAVIRPLIECERAAIDRFCRRYRPITGEDESNAALQFTRNRIRHDLLPKLRADYNPNIAAGLNRLAGLMRDEEDWLEGLAAAHLRRVTVSEDENHIHLDSAVMAPWHPALQRRVLRAALQHIRGNLRRIGFASIEALRRRLGTERGEGLIDLPGDLRAAFGNGRLRLGPLPSPDPPPRAFAYEMTGTGSVPIRETGMRLCLEHLDHVDRESIHRAGQDVVYFDMDQIAFPITIRSFRPGDRFVPFGMRGSQKLKKHFIDHKVPRAQRADYPLVVSGGEIIWIAGLRRSDRARIGPQSAAILKIELRVA